jgi:hypothetical protein
VERISLFVSRQRNLWIVSAHLRPHRSAPVPIDRFEKVRIADGTDFDHVHFAREQVSQPRKKSEIRAGVSDRVGNVELHQKIDIAPLGIETGPRRRTEDFEAHDPKTAAQLRDLPRTLFDDGNQTAPSIRQETIASLPLAPYRVKFRRSDAATRGSGGIALLPMASRLPPAIISEIAENRSSPIAFAQ